MKKVKKLDINLFEGVTEQKYNDMKYKFLGKPDKIFPQLKTGKFYELEVEEVRVRFLENPKGWLFGMTKPYVVSGLGLLRCPYSSWETFYQNWELVKRCLDMNL